MGTATAGGHEETIVMRGFNFDPKKTSLDVGGGSKTVRFVYDEVVGSEPNHNVVLVDDRKIVQAESDWGEGLVQSEFIMQDGDHYDVTFSTDGDDLIIEETGGETSSNVDDPDNETEAPLAGEKATLTGALSDGGTTVDYVCSHHAANMWGRLEITG